MCVCVCVCECVTHEMGYHSGMSEILPLATTRIDLEGITLSEISQRKTDPVSLHLYGESKKLNK